MVRGFKVRFGRRTRSHARVSRSFALCFDHSRMAKYIVLTMELCADWAVLIAQAARRKVPRLASLASKVCTVVDATTVVKVSQQSKKPTAAPAIPW